MGTRLKPLDNNKVSLILAIQSNLTPQKKFEATKGVIRSHNSLKKKKKKKKTRQWPIRQPIMVDKMQITKLKIKD